MEENLAPCTWDRTMHTLQEHLHVFWDKKAENLSGIDNSEDGEECLSFQSIRLFMVEFYSEESSVLKQITSLLLFAVPIRLFAGVVLVCANQASSKRNKIISLIVCTKCPLTCNRVVEVWLVPGSFFGSFEPPVVGSGSRSWSKYDLQKKIRTPGLHVV